MVVMNECGTLLALLDLLIPMLFWLKRPSEISFLPFWMSLSFHYITRVGLTKTRYDEISRVDSYYQESTQGVPSWLPG